MAELIGLGLLNLAFVRLLEEICWELKALAIVNHLPASILACLAVRMVSDRCVSTAGKPGLWKKLQPDPLES